MLYLKIGGACKCRNYLELLPQIPFFTVVCVFGFEFLARFRSCCCRCWVCCGGSAGVVCLNTQDIN